ncbi:MAG TPA: alanine dehydrogenase [Limnochordia bacterium]|nr:alanine dehydrogenase [Limnochordia bacterium]
MIIGVPKEIKDNENRVGMTPAGVEELVKRHGHRVLVERGAGEGSGISDEQYAAAGAQIVDGPQEVYQAELIVKVKEPLPSEYGLLRREQILMTYLHLAAAPQLAKELARIGVVAVGYETIQRADGSLPCLIPMSEVAGRMAVQIGAQYLEKVNGGRGVLLGGVPGVPPAEVVIIGAGTVGTNAARVALGMGAHVTIIDINVDRLRFLEEVLHGNLLTVVSNRYNIERAVRYADLLIGSVLVPGAKAPTLVTEEMVASMKRGAVIIDVAVDQGGCIETVDRATTHSDPIYVKHGVVHYAVPNMPGAVPRTSTYALTNATLPYIVEVANRGYREAARQNPALAKGFNLCLGRAVHPGVADALGWEYTPLTEVL